ncbi:MAG: hypothetical protein JNJ40_15370 [Bacteroidia bacterium]|nr:hypothetical protein [Bacteroidia bacterium]
MKIERGIITADMSSEHVHVRGIGTLSKLNVTSLFERYYKNGEAVLGTIIDKKYTLCQNFKLKTGENFFGYIVRNSFGSSAISVQVISNFDKDKYYLYNQDKDYKLGEELVLKKENILGFFDENEKV